MILLLSVVSKSFAQTINKVNVENGIIGLMYHRFDENKYPSTNIRTEIFLKHIEEINKVNSKFINFQEFEQILENNIDRNYILLTIDDAFSSFYENAWPILKNKKIPFILFVSTQEIGKYGYMNWEQIKEIEKSNLVTIGNHSHSHEYLIDWDDGQIYSDIETSIKIFKENLGYSPEIFSYPFGEYSTNLKKITSNLNFKYAFGQHSGVIDITKDLLELPRFPINEKYGEIERFKSIINTLPFPYQSISPENRYLKNDENPPEVRIKFYEDLIDIKNITCYSNEGNKWRRSEIKFLNKSEILVLINEKFITERGRINCSLLGNNGKWRWLGIQYVISEL
mgnify:FL=1